MKEKQKAKVSLLSGIVGFNCIVRLCQALWMSGYLLDCTVRELMIIIVKRPGR